MPTDVGDIVDRGRRGGKVFGRELGGRRHEKTFSKEKTRGKKYLYYHESATQGLVSAGQKKEKSG